MTSRKDIFEHLCEVLQTNAVVNDPQTFEFQLKNTDLALARWKTVDPASVVEDLEVWRCGTQACFGGHLSTWPEFQELGLVSWDDGQPLVAGNTSLPPALISLAVFGQATLFNAVSYRDEGKTEHEIVINRLEANRLHLVWARDRAMGGSQ